eukprot:UN20396
MLRGKLIMKDLLKCSRLPIRSTRCRRLGRGRRTCSGKRSMI